MNYIIKTIFLALTLSLAVYAADGFLGCQGLVKPSEDIMKNLNGSTDFSDVSIQLIDSENFIADEQKCSPQGLFVIPVYNAGSYTLKVANVDGWTIQPSSLPVSLSPEGTLDGCSSMINFVVTGFTVDGSVLDIDQVHGMENIDVLLSSPLLSVPISMKTDKNGVFSFSNLIPGSYTVSVYHPTWTIQAPASRTIEITWGNVHFNTPFVISGYSIRGSLSGNGVAETLNDIEIILSLESHQLLECDGSHVRSNEDHTTCIYSLVDAPTFTFNNVKPGQYIITYVLLHQSTWSISPESYSVTIESDGVSLEPFVYNGYIKVGRVVDAQNNGVEAVKILTNDGNTYTTDKDGYYTLKNLKNEQYTIKAEKKHLRFTSIDTLMSMSTILPDIHITSLHVCGAILTDSVPSYIQLPDELTVFITDNQNIKKQVKTSNEYHYCFNVEPNDYVIYVDDSNLDIKFGSNSVTVENQTFIVDSNIVPIYRTVKGSLNIHDDINNVILTLTNSKNNNVKYVFDTKNFVDNTFTFMDIIPASYVLTIRNINTGCWNTKEGELVNKNIYSVDVDCTVSDVMDIIINNSMFAMDISTSLPVTMTLSSHYFTHEYALTELHTLICLEAESTYSLSYAGCITSKETKYSINKETRVFTIDDTVEKHILMGSIAFDNTVTIIPIQVSLLISKDDIVIDTLAIKTNGQRTVNYSLALPVGDYTLSVDTTNTAILYSPAFILAHVDNKACDQQMSVISAENGVIVKGKIVPPLQRVDIKMYSADDSKTLLQSTVTDENGDYSFKPIATTLAYTLEAYREGHHFQKSQDGTIFTHKQLASISILLKDQYDHPISSTILTLSGEGYMNTFISRPDGTMVFGELFPSTYTLMMNNKEYTFTPSVMSVTLNEGEARDLHITGTKVAYSIFGSVLSLSGSPLSMFSLEAKSMSANHKEIATSDANGLFRIRGLKPNTEYILSIKTKEHSKVDHFIPREYTYNNDIDDIHNVTFVAIYKPDTIPLEGTIEGLPINHTPLKIKACDTDKTCQNINLVDANTFVLNYKHDTTVTFTVSHDKNEDIYTICDSVTTNVQHGQLNTVSLHCTSSSSVQTASSPLTILSLLLVSAVTIAIFYFVERDNLTAIFKH